MISPQMRKGCLTAFLSLVVLANIAAAILFLNSIITGASKTSTNSQLIPVLIGIFIGNVICAIAVWRMHRWGVIGYTALTLISYGISSSITGNWTNVIGLAGAAILATMILPYWKQMAW